MRYLIPFVIFILYLPLNITAQGTNKVIDTRTQRAIRNGIQYIIGYQKLDKQKEDYGAFYNPRSKRYSIAITSFACLSLLANGNLPNRGKYGKEVAAGLDFILNSVNNNGYISRRDDHSKMHGHGFALLFLAEVYGMKENRSKYGKLFLKKLKRATLLTLNSQTKEGGWGYSPGDMSHEGSITVCQLQALRAVRNIGIRVPKKNILRAIDYLKRSANPDGTFKYRLNMPSRRKSFPLTAAGVSSLNATGEYESPEVKKGLTFMMGYLPPWGKTDRYYQAFYYYGQFYAAQAMYQAPKKYWEKWYPAVRDDLLKKQNKGAWGNRGSGYSRFGSVYATSIATLILQIPYNYLPIFQK